MLGSLRKTIDAIFAEYESRCLWFSNGSDSRLLLEVMLETRKPFGILMFEEGWNRQQRKQVEAVIMRHNLMVLTYPAVANVLVGEGDEVSLVSQYAINGFGETVMLVKDLVDDPKRCIHDVKLPKAVIKAAPIEFDAHIWGLRASDRHYLLGDKPPVTSPTWEAGGKRFFGPLAENWDSQAVRDTLKTEYGVDLSGEKDTGNIDCCSLCYRSEEPVLCPKTNEYIPAVKWDREGNTAKIRSFLER